MFGDTVVTPFSGAIIRAGRAIFGTFLGSGAFVMLGTRTVVPVLADDVFTSRGNVTNAAVRRGSALLTGSTMSVAALSLRAKTFYEGPAAFIRNATVGDDVPDTTKDTLIAKVAEYYGIEADLTR